MLQYLDSSSYIVVLTPGSLGLARCCDLTCKEYPAAYALSAHNVICAVSGNGKRMFLRKLWGCVCKLYDLAALDTKYRIKSYH